MNLQGNTGKHAFSAYVASNCGGGEISSSATTNANNTRNDDDGGGDGGGGGGGGKAPRLRPLLALSASLLQLYRGINPSYAYSPKSNPRRVLTNPAEPVLNGGIDNEKGDYILYVGDTLGEKPRQRYQIQDILGHGTFGQVVRCNRLYDNVQCAVKVVKNKPAYFNQGFIEIRVLEQLNNSFDPNDTHHIVRLMDYIVYNKHLCLVFEPLSINLYELIKQNSYRGVSTNLMRLFVVQLLDALALLARAGIIHADLKPENVLLENLSTPAIKLIDFGSACFESQASHTYIQSRFYRSPEVLLGLRYSTQIDVWSLGCLAAELFLGLPVFPGSSEHDQLRRIMVALGEPPNYMLERGKNVAVHFKRRLATRAHAASTGALFQYELKTAEQYAIDTRTQLKPAKRYFKTNDLRLLVTGYPMRAQISPEEKAREMAHREAFLHWLRGVLCFDPRERWTAAQAKLHPFVLGQVSGPNALKLVSMWRPPKAAEAAAIAAEADGENGNARASGSGNAARGMADVLATPPRKSTHSGGMERRATNAEKSNAKDAAHANAVNADTRAAGQTDDVSMREASGGDGGERATSPSAAPDDSRRAAAAAVGRGVKDRSRRVTVGTSNDAMEADSAMHARSRPRLSPVSLRDKFEKSLAISSQATADSENADSGNDAQSSPANIVVEKRARKTRANTATQSKASTNATATTDVRATNATEEANDRDDESRSTSPGLNLKRSATISVPASHEARHKEVVAGSSAWRPGLPAVEGTSYPPKRPESPVASVVSQKSDGLGAHSSGAGSAGVGGGVVGGVVRGSGGGRGGSRAGFAGGARAANLGGGSLSGSRRSDGGRAGASSRSGGKARSAIVSHGGTRLTRGSGGGSASKRGITGGGGGGGGNDYARNVNRYVSDGDDVALVPHDVAARSAPGHSAAFAGVGSLYSSPPTRSLVRGDVELDNEATRNKSPQSGGGGSSAGTAGGQPGSGERHRRDRGLSNESASSFDKDTSPRVVGDSSFVFEFDD